MNSKELEAFRKSIDFESYLQEKLKNPVFRQYFDEFGRQLEISYALLQMRKKSKLSQAQVAKKIGTSQSNIARIEAGRENFTVQTLEKFAKAYKRNLKVEFV